MPASVDVLRGVRTNMSGESGTSLLLQCGRRPCSQKLESAQASLRKPSKHQLGERQQRPGLVTSTEGRKQGELWLFRGQFNQQPHSIAAAAQQSPCPWPCMCKSMAMPAAVEQLVQNWLSKPAHKSLECAFTEDRLTWTPTILSW